jgi:O-antigen/teichoic acid export membrane protein
VKRGKAVKDTVGIFITRFIWSGMGLISGVALTRYLGPENRGILTMLVQTIPSTVLTLTKLGVSQATVYYVNRDKTSPSRVASNSVTLAIVLGSLSAFLIWMFRDALANNILKGIPDWALAIALLRLPLLLIDNFLYGVLQATGQFSLYNVRLLASEGVKLVLVVIVVVLQLGLWAAVWMYTLIQILNIGWLMFSMRHTVPIRLRLDRKLLANMMSFGVRSYVQLVIQNLLLRIDIYMVQIFFGPAQVGFYSLGVHLIETLGEVPQAIGVVLYPRLATLPEEEMHRLTAQTCRRTLLLTVPAAVGLVLIGPYIITLLYGQRFAPAAAPLPWLAVGNTALAIFVIVTRNFTARSKQRVNTVAGLLALIINVALNLYTIPHYGIVGAAFATAVAYTAACIVLLRFFCAESGQSWTTVLIPRGDDIRYFLTMAQRGLVRATARFA